MKTPKPTRMHLEMEAMSSDLKHKRYEESQWGKLWRWAIALGILVLLDTFLTLHGYGVVLGLSIRAIAGHLSL